MKANIFGSLSRRARLNTTPEEKIEPRKSNRRMPNEKEENYRRKTYPSTINPLSRVRWLNNHTAEGKRHQLPTIRYISHFRAREQALAGCRQGNRIWI
jgi:hypothetical protein